MTIDYTLCLKIEITVIYQNGSYMSPKFLNDTFRLLISGLKCDSKIKILAAKKNLETHPFISCQGIFHFHTQICGKKPQSNNLFHCFNI